MNGLWDRSDSTIHTRVSPSGFAVLTVLLFCCCAGRTVTLRWDVVDKILPGETNRAMVLEMLGEPTAQSTEKGPQIESSFYVYQDNKTQGSTVYVRRVEVEFIDGVVNAYIFRNASKQEPTWFEPAGRNRLQAGTDTRRDVEAAFGRPSGLVRWPSNILGRDPLGKVDVPGGTVEVWHYGAVFGRIATSLLGYEKALDKWYGRYLYAFFSVDGTLLDYRYFDNIPEDQEWRTAR